jgi:hypothetical protein
MIALNGWSLGDLAVFGVLAVLMFLTIAYNRAIAAFMLNFSSYTSWPPARIPREDRPERLRQIRESRSTYLPVARFYVVLFASLTLAACIVALILGR